MTSTSGILRSRAPLPRRIGADFVGFAAVIAALNLPLVFGRAPAAFVVSPPALARGAWWTLLTHPFVHVSAYHLLLDAGSFLGLYAMLGSRSPARRLWLVAAAAAGSLAAAFTAPGFAALGFCGLSGVAHGLMAAVALDLAASPDAPTRRLGTVVFLAVALKSGFEAWTGGVVFGGLHLGDVGQPLAVCHAGGFIGGCASGLAWQRRICHCPLRNANRRERVR